MLVDSYTAQAGGAGRSLLDFMGSIEPRPVEIGGLTFTEVDFRIDTDVLATDARCC